MLLAIPASAKDNKDKTLIPDERPKVFEELVNCRAIADRDERLACYDAKVAAMDEAEKKDEIVLADKAAVKEAKRGLFGFNLPKIRLFGKGDDEGDEDNSRLTTVIQDARQDAKGRWVITLEDGAVWSQIDSEKVRRAPAQGMSIAIRKASMGTYFANIDGQRAIRMRRTS